MIFPSLSLLLNLFSLSIIKYPSQMLSFQAQWSNILDTAGQQTINFSNFYLDHEIRKLSLYKLKIPEVRQKIEEFAIRYNSDSLQSSKTWMQNQYRIFLWTLLHHSKIIDRPPIQFNFDDWNLLSKLFNKSPIICNYFYLCSRKGRSKPWSHEQDSFLGEVMKLPHYQSRWTDIGMLMFVQTQGQSFRKPKTIRERWLNHLNPELIKDQWTLEEDLKICRLVLEEGKRWSMISKKLSNRSEHSVKNRFNSLLHRRVHRSRFESKRREEESVIKKYIKKIEGLLEREKAKESEKKETVENEGNDEEDKKQVVEVGSFNYGTNSYSLCLFQPLMINPFIFNS